jgi:hypothetical protein
MWSLFSANLAMKVLTNTCGSIQPLTQLLDASPIQINNCGCVSYGRVTFERGFLSLFDLYAKQHWHGV